MRSSSTLPSGFRAVLKEVTYHLGYEATSFLQTRPVAVSVPIKPSSSSSSSDANVVETMGEKLADRVTLVPIMRSGLGMADAMLELLPMAGVHHIGMYKRSGMGTGGGMMPVQYYNRLPRQCNADWAFILDPVIATATTMMSVIGILKKWGVPKIGIISVIASKEGLKTIAETHPDVYVTVGTVDGTLQKSDTGEVLPGLGDAGDRIYGTQQEDDEALLHPSKRKRSESFVEETTAKVTTN